MTAAGAPALPGTDAAPPRSRGGHALACYHCAAPVPRGLDLSVDIAGKPRPMCCPGCEAVARAIIAAGLEDYYRFRTETAHTAEAPVPAFLREARAYDNPRVQRSFVRSRAGGLREASLILEGVTCPACIWLNERRLESLTGVVEAQVNYSTRRARVIWDSSRVRLSEILQAVHRIGYRAYPYDPARREQLLERERRAHLKRMGVAGVFGMQVMMLALALYFGAFSGMETQYRALFHWVSLLFAAPVVVYCAYPFFSGAMRDLALRRTGMDVPVSLGIGLAFAASAWNTVTGTGEVYFDSVVMFVFFLLVARYFEFAARRRSAQAAETLVNPAPRMAVRLVGTQEESVAVADLRPGDRLLVRPGDTVPADGWVLEGRSSVNEALVTGESRPVSRGVGDALIGGSVNTESPLILRVERVGRDTVLSRMLELAERAQMQKPPMARLADRAASAFVAGVLTLAAGVALYWWWTDPDAWLAVTVAVLVVTCPCALSLAMPTAVSAGIDALTRSRLIVTRARALEGLARVTHFVFDKTGTLTCGGLRIVQTRTYTPMDGDACLRIAAALERQSEHPVARAIVAALHRDAPNAEDVSSVPGGGLRGRVEGRAWYLGTQVFIRTQTGLALDGAQAAELSEGEDTVVLLADDEHIRCAFHLADELRPGARGLVDTLVRDGKEVLILSGDHEAAVRRVAGGAGITQAHANLRPEDKLAQIKAIQARGGVVAAVGDGVNDAPVLAGADVSVAMAGGADLTRASADIILLSGHLTDLGAGVGLAAKATRIVRQNLVWAVGYNLVALSAAAAGYVAPWLAAIGMSASSLLVVANTLRLVRGPGCDTGATKWTFSTY
ncbi:MAG: heavy metal translocating P-type ATPase [Gammaproteobacteria bacterium]|nr:heavy metal translocating P-type ATPase [Gammaproteobacteria bacterium]NIR83524.1 heavy metal translocating P-type ATPase [Gammaproteobacteria bacterium]NIR91446.1 heavy metal translocating P-type ATPase [Gammaproteobacteria bacterium]NIU04686.1 heavy metal translocating P-type ATPase [Gammaproteobacteria bacterium]NIV51728.1 heavy metal translocating P-type ATPase [Gammaproteobacteria bacterium]